MNFWKNKRILITGGAGFLGSFVVEKLQERGCIDIFIPRSSEYDLVDNNAVKQLYQDTNPNLVLHLAAVVGGIGANRKNPGKFFYDNLMMGVQMMEQGRLHGVEKFVAIGTICSYPKFTPVPFREEALWDGYPEETNAPYGLAKKMLLAQSQAYRQQYEFNSIFLLPVNLYGPRDNFDLDTAHVIPALIRRCLDLNFEYSTTNLKQTLTVWGTGKPTREFLYVEDAAEAILLASERYNKSEPINIGAGFEITIKDLTDLIVKLTSFKGEITWDATKPDGQPRRSLDISKSKKEFDFTPKTDFEEGLSKTISYYEKKNFKK